MATRTWTSAASTDMNDTANYDGSGSFATDDLVFNNTSVVNAAATAGITCNSITIASNYTGTWSLSGQTATLAQGFSDDGITGAHNYGNGITCGGASATFHVGSGVGTITASSCVLTMNGTTSMIIDDDKGIFIKTLTLGASAVVTLSGAQPTNILHTGTNLIFTNGGTLTLNQQLTLNVGGSVDAYSITGSPTINGNSTLNIRGNAAGLTVGLPAITMTGTTTLNIRHGSAFTTTFSQSGTISCVTLQILTASTGTTTFTTNNNAITTSGAFSFGANNAGSTFTLNAGSSTFTVGGAVNSTAYNAGTININLSTSQWVVAGNFTFQSNFTVSEGTSSVTFSGTGATNTVTSNGKCFYDVTCNKTATGGVTFADATCIHGDLVVSGTNTQAISWTGTTMSVSMDVTIDGSGTLNMGNGVTMTGNSATLHLGSTLSTVTASSCALTMNGTTGMTIDDDKSVTFKSLTLGASAVVTNSGGANGTFSSSTTPLTFTNGGTLTLNRQLSFELTSNGSLINITAGSPTINGTQLILLKYDNGVAATLPALTFSGTLDVYFINSGASDDGSISLNGNLVVADQFFVAVNSANSDLTFNTNNYSITCGGMTVGASNATGTVVFNAGSSTISISSYSNYNTGNSTINMGTSTWSCSGSWTFGTNQTITGTAASQSVTFTNTATITSASKVFPGALIINASGKTITLADALSIAGNLTFTAGTLAGAFSTTCAGDVTTAANVTFNRLILTKATTRTVTIGAGTTLTVSNLTDTNFNGTAGALTQWRSSTTGVQANLAIPAPITLTYQYPQDNAASFLITANDAGSVDGGNTTNWLLPAASGTVNKKISKMHLPIGIGV